MLHENFEALVANIANQIDQLPVEELPSLVITNNGIFIDDKRSTRARFILSLLTPQPGHTHDVTFDKELQDAFAHNNMQFVKVGDTVAYGLRRNSIAAAEPEVFWLHVSHDADEAPVLGQARGVVNDLKKNTDGLFRFNIDEINVDCTALNWHQLLGMLMTRTDPDRRFRLVSNTEYDFVLSKKAITYYQETISKRPMMPVAYLDDTNLFNGGDFNDSDTNWGIAPSGSTRPVVKVYV